MNYENWENNSIQFPRLISELEGLGIFKEKTMTDLAVAMDVSQLDVAELLDRAFNEWEKIKAGIFS